MTNGKIDVEVVGTLQQRIESCLNVLDVLLTSSQAIVSSIVVADKNSHETTQDNQLTLIKSVMKIMGIRDVKSISKNASLAEVGMDSLMSVEIKQVLERGFDVFLTAQQLRSITFAKLEEMSAANTSERNSSSSPRERETHLEILFKNLGDESVCDETLVSINSVTTSPSVIFIPGKDGLWGVWRDFRVSKNLCMSSVGNERKKFLDKNCDFLKLIDFSSILPPLFWKFEK